MTNKKRGRPFTGRTGKTTSIYLSGEGQALWCVLATHCGKNKRDIIELVLREAAQRRSLPPATTDNSDNEPAQ